MQATHQRLCLFCQEQGDLFETAPMTRGSQGGQFSQATFFLQNHTSQGEIRADCLTPQLCSRSSNNYKLTLAIHTWVAIWSVNMFKVNANPSNTFRLHYPFLSPSCCLQTKGIHSVLLSRSKCNKLYMACSGRKQCGMSYHCTDIRPLQAVTVTH